MPRKKKPAEINIEEIREQLLLKRDEILQKNVQHDLGSQESSKGDLVDQSTDQTERELMLGMVEGDRAKLREIEEALRIMDENQYGICKECEQPIPIKRLLAVPTAKHCVPCREKLERLGSIETETE